MVVSRCTFATMCFRSTGQSSKLSTRLELSLYRFSLQSVPPKRPKPHNRNTHHLSSRVFLTIYILFLSFFLSSHIFLSHNFLLFSLSPSESIYPSMCTLISPSGSQVSAFPIFVCLTRASCHLFSNSVSGIWNRTRFIAFQRFIFGYQFIATYNIPFNINV